MELRTALAAGAFLLAGCSVQSISGIYSCQSNADCTGGQMCSPNGQCLPLGFDGGQCTKTENTPAECSNGFDDDCNGLTDCQDPGCNGIQCSAGSVCAQKTCSAGCFIDGVFAASGSSPASQPCQVCSPSLTLTAWVNLPMGMTATGCDGVFVCNGKGECEQAQGVTCAANADCASGFCVDGVCCNTACNGTCEACSEVKTGQADGTCASVLDGTDPGADCPGAYACVHGGCAVTCGGCSDTMNCTSDGYCVAGQCLVKKANGLTPDTCGATTCASGVVSNGICCSSTCSGACESCLAAETGTTQGTCAPIPAGGPDPEGTCSAGFACNGHGACATSCTGCSDTTDCIQGYYCSGSTCLTTTANGATIGSCGARQCTSGSAYGPDGGGICCDADCNAKCESCLGSQTGMSDGHCSAITAGTDPNFQCPGSYTCNGNGACATTCSGNSGCRDPSACKAGNYCATPDCEPLIAPGTMDNATCGAASCESGDADGGFCE
jgi:hypothetical protein